MSKIEFENDNAEKLAYSSHLVQSKSVAKWLVEKRIVNNETQANAILVLIAVILFTFAGWFFYKATAPAPFKYYLTQGVVNRLPPDVQQAIKSASSK